MTGYAEFLASKRRRVGDHGRHVEAGEIHPSLFGWQNLIVRWAVRKGRAAIFADTGLGKTAMQLEWARLISDRALIVAPLAVAQQTVREGQRIGVEVRYVRDGSQATGDGLFVTNYEMSDRFDMATFPAVVLDESSRLKNVDGKTRQRLTEQMRDVPYRLACTATPAPNDIAELTNHAEWLGAASRAEMLAAYFVNDGKNWRLKGHAAGPMFRWMASWAVALRRPSDLGWPDDGYLLPGLDIRTHLIEVPIEADGQLFPTDLGGVGGRARVRRETLEPRVDAAADLVLAEPGEPWVVWCGLNDEADRVTERVGAAGLRVVNVEGAWTPDDKADALEAFADGRIQVMVTKASVAGFGLNWQHCARHVFVGLSDSWESYYQCIRRSYRFGQTREVVAHVVLSELEGQIFANVAGKEREATMMTGRLVDAMRDTWLSEEVPAA